MSATTLRKLSAQLCAAPNLTPQGADLMVRLDATANILQGLEDSAAGRVSDLGDFVQYAEVEEDGIYAEYLDSLENWQTYGPDA